MKRLFLSMFALLLMQFSVVSLTMASNPAISFHSTENGFRISLSDIDISQVSDCSWGGVPICDELAQQVQAGHITMSRSGSQIHFDIPITEGSSGIFDNSPVFTVILASGETVSAPAAFASSGDISYSGGDAVMDSYLDDVFQSLRKYKADNPHASQADLSQHVKTLLGNTNTQLRSARRAYYDIEGYMFNLLNDQEIALYRQNRYYALLCMANGKLAIEYSEAKYKRNTLRNGNGDAFRHALWNYGMALDVGYSFAKRWSDAHEYGTPNNDSLEERMDLFNNSVGLRLALDNPWTFWHSTFINNTIKKVRAGKMRIIRNGRLVASSSAGEK